MPIDLSDPDICDFLVSNCHKWCVAPALETTDAFDANKSCIRLRADGYHRLSAKRAVAMLWVPERNQHLIRSSYPTSLAYGSGPFHAMFSESRVSSTPVSVSRESQKAC